MAKVLLVDDDQNLVRSLREYLCGEQHTVEVAYNGLDGLQLLENFQFDIVLLDWNLPDVSGLDVLRRFRKARGATPIIFLTGQTQVAQKLDGLESGADDYITKPFNLQELSARVKAVLRRPRGLVADTRSFGDLTIIEGTRQVQIDGRTVNLGRREYAVLEFLLRNPNRTFSTRELMKAIWPSDSEASDDAVRVCVNSLRKKISSSDGSCIVKTILGSGYIVELDKQSQ